MFFVLLFLSGLACFKMPHIKKDRFYSLIRLFRSARLENSDLEGFGLSRSTAQKTGIYLIIEIGVFYIFIIKIAGFIVKY